METPQIQEGNKLIAEFLCAEKLPEVNNFKIPGFEIPALRYERYGDMEAYLGTTDKFKLYEAKFHSEWNWLMPVVHKIYDITDDDTKSFNGLVIFEIGLATPIDEIFKAVVEFIVWYNNDKSKV